MKLASTLLAATALIALAGCNRTAGNNSSTANGAATNVAPPPATNAAAPAAGNSAKPADQPAGENMMEEDAGAEESSAEANVSK